MKRILSFILCLTMIMSFASIVHAERYSKFTDVTQDSWYYEDVDNAVRLGIINGKTETTFAPDDNLTYAEAIKLAACMYQLYKDGSVYLVSGGNPWYETYVNYAKDHGIITDNFFEKINNINEKATRAGYMEIFASALPDEALECINNVPDGSIPDVPMVHESAIGIYKLYRAGILTGVDANHNCKPEDNIKRCEVAAIISRMMNDDKRIEFDMPGTSGKEEPKEEPKTEEPGKDNQKTDSLDDPGKKDNTQDEPINIPTETPEKTDEVPTQTVTQDVTVTPTKPVNGGQQLVPDTELTIHKQPEGLEAEEYGGKHELSVQVFGGKAPYTYEWYYKVRRDNVTIENGDYAKDAQSEALILSIEKENSLLGTNIYCKITDSQGVSVTTEPVKVYGPFSMPVDESLSDSGKYTLVGRVADGILKKGEKVSVIRNGKVIAIGVAEDLQMFNKSMDETVKGDNVGIVFNREDGVRPTGGDIVVKYQPSHKIDTSDIVN